MKEVGQEVNTEGISSAYSLLVATIQCEVKILV
jgi:hypothetical protein